MGGPDFVMCPLVDENIEPIDCIENSDAVDGIIKKETVPKRFKKKPNCCLLYTSPSPRD